jgi:hypothetical protein
VISRRDISGTSRLAGWAMAVALAVPAAAGGHAGAATQDPAATQRRWALRLAIHYLPPATNRSQYDVVLAWPGQTWLLGGTNVAGQGKPKAVRLRNGIPRSTALPTGAHSWITAASALSRTSIWAVTSLGGSVLRWNGSAWLTEPRGNWKAGTRFTGITAISQKNVWVFGTAGRRHPGAGTWHFSGTAWTRVRGAADGIFLASAATATDIWGIGNAGATGNALLHFGGSTWRRVRPAHLAGFTFTHVLALSRTNVWVAGKVAGIPKLGHFDGHGWAAVRMPGRTAATGMCRDGRGGLWVIANSGTAPSVVRERSAAGVWTKALVSQNAADQIVACALVPGTKRAWGAGRADAPSGTAAAGYRTG